MMMLNEQKRAPGLSESALEILARPGPGTHDPAIRADLFEKLALTAREVNESNGWDVPVWENLPMELLLVATGIDEAMEAIEGTGEKGPVEEKIADVWIRTADILVSVWAGQWILPVIKEKPWPRPPQLFPRGVLSTANSAVWAHRLWAPLRLTCQAAECCRHQKKNEALRKVEGILAETMKIASFVDIDLVHQVAKKLSKSAGRPK